MSFIVINTNDSKEETFMLELLKKLKLKAGKISDEDWEDMMLGELIREGET